MRRTFSFVTSLFSNKKNVRRDRRGDVSRRVKRLLQNIQLDLLEERQLLATYLVINTSDDVSASGSLRWAIAQANANTTDASDLITFDPSLNGQTITLTAANGPFVIADGSGKNLNIYGPGQNNLTISGGNQSGIFDVRTPATISNLTIKYGNGANLAYGGAIYNNHTTLSLSYLNLANNTSSSGGAIYSSGTSGTAANLTITNSNFSYNNAIYGGAVTGNGFNGTSILAISNSTFGYNSANFGGAVRVEGTTGMSVVNISDSVFTNQTAWVNGGAVHINLSSCSTAYIERSRFGYSQASNWGSAIYTNSNLTLVDSYLHNSNSAKGGIFQDSYTALLSVSRSTFAFNSAVSPDGTSIFFLGNLRFDKSTVANDTAIGIFSIGGNADITSSTFAYNFTGLVNQVGYSNITNTIFTKSGGWDIDAFANKTTM